MSDVERRISRLFQTKTDRRKFTLGMGVFLTGCSQKQETEIPFQRIRSPQYPFYPYDVEYPPTVLKNPRKLEIDPGTYVDTFDETSVVDQTDASVVVEATPINKGTVPYTLDDYENEVRTHLAQIPQTAPISIEILARPTELRQKGWFPISGNPAYINRIIPSQLKEVRYAALFLARDLKWEVSLVAPLEKEQKMLPIYKHMLATLHVDAK